MLDLVPNATTRARVEPATEATSGVDRAVALLDGERPELRVIQR